MLDIQDAWRRDMRVAHQNLSPQQVDAIATQIPLAPKFLNFGSAEPLARLAQEQKAGIWTWEILPLRNPRSASGKVRSALRRQGVLEMLAPSSHEAVLGIGKALEADILANSPGYIGLNRFQVGGAEVFHWQARGFVAVERLSSTLGASDHVLLTGVGSNRPPGAWRIRRGPNHPFVVATQALRAWHAAHEDGRPILRKSGGKRVIRLWATEVDARICSSSGSATAASGYELLRLCSLADTISLPDGSTFDTRDSVDELAHMPSQIIEALTECFGKDLSPVT